MKCRINGNITPNISNNRIKDNMKKIIHESGHSVDVENIIIPLYDYMMSLKFFGGCHALSSVLYVALCELELHPELYIGECQLKGETPFDHSWISLEGKIIDLAIYMPLNQKINSISGPIIFDVDAITSNKTKLEYGINTGLPMNDETQIVINTDFCDYMSGFPVEFGGLWSVLKKIMPQSYDFNLLALKKKYKGTTRQVVR